MEFEPYDDGFGIMKDNQTAKPQAFRTGDGWFSYNLNPYQGGMCNSEVLKTAERTPHHLMSHIGPNWVATDNAAWRYVHFTLALV